MDVHFPKFTIVVPTRERWETLHSTLMTCTMQDYGNLEILVSDNFSQDKTREVVESFGDRRIRYMNTGKRLGMTQNWEFALSCVSGDYVTFLGDDDGLLPDAVKEITSQITEIGEVKVFSWKRAIYYWPGTNVNFQNNVLTLSTSRRLLKLNAAQELRKVASFESLWYSLPSIYSSFVSLDSISELRQRSNGKFFNSSIPDVYSAVALACVIPEYYLSLKPYSIAGISRYSTGNSFSYINSNPEPAQRFLSENEIPIHEKMVISSSPYICVTECLLQAKDLSLIPDDIEIDLRLLIKAVLLSASAESDSKYAITLDELRQIGVRNNLDSFVSEAIAKAVHLLDKYVSLASGHTIWNGELIIDCNRFHVHNVYEAALLCDRILHAGRLSFIFPIGTIKLTLVKFLQVLRRKFCRFIK